MLRDLRLRRVYRSDEDNLLSDFYIPALKQSLHYDRAVGFFSAGMIAIAAQGLSALIESGGSMRLIIGADLEESDFRAIDDGYRLRSISERIGREILRIFDSVEDGLFYRRVEALSWLVASGRLDVRVALRRRGMYHEKLGILTDLAGDKVVFVGSANETPNALLPDFNFESINVFESWKPELVEYCTPYIGGFEKLWSNRAAQTRVIEFPDAVKEKLIAIAKTARLPSTKIEAELWEKLRRDASRDETSEIASQPRVPDLLGSEPFELMAHQREALEAWRANALQGIMALATGSGKTVTAIYGAVKIFEQTKRLFLVVAVPYQNLADQWMIVLRDFGIVPIRCYASRASWKERLGECVTLFQSGALKFACAVVVNQTLQSEAFQGLLREIQGEFLVFVGDECHHHAAPGVSACLPGQASVRLGLSATPEHYRDSEANQRLSAYYGKVVFEYSLEDALRDKVLSAYRYRVIPVELTDEEAERYAELSKQISALVGKGGVEDSELLTDPRLSILLFERARLLGAARNKLVGLDKLLRQHPAEPLSLFYCGDGSVEDEDSGELVRQVDAVSELLHNRGWSNAHFTSRESREERRQILDNFRLGFVNALVAIRCLDEGIDIPACRTAFMLASSRNPRQSVQRRGRLLRKSPNKDRADIFDFIVLLPSAVAEFNFERSLFKAELQRVAEFARLAENSGEVVGTLSPLLTQFDLQHILV
jgi:superfamily II DNA or RNA helicase